MVESTLNAAMLAYGPDAYLLTVSDAGPHTSHVQVALRDGRLCCQLSRTAAANIGRNPNVSLLWPPRESGGYSIIVNGVAHAGGATDAPQAYVDVNKSVFHRPGAPREGNPSCTSDCRQLPIVELAQG